MLPRDGAGEIYVPGATMKYKLTPMPRLHPPQTRRHHTSTALALVIIIPIIVLIVALLLSASPARGLTITPMPRLTATPVLVPVAWLIVERDYAAPLVSNCVAPGPCGQETK